MKSVLLLAIGIHLELCSFSLAAPSRPNIRSASDVDGNEIVTCTTTPVASGPAIGTPTSTPELAQNAIVSSSPSSPAVKGASESSSAVNTGLSSGAVLGLTVGASMVIAATLMSFVLWCFCIRRHRRASSQHPLLDISSPGLPQQPHKPTRTNSDLSQWTATSSSPLQPLDPRLRPLRLPDVAFPRNKNLLPSPVEMMGDIYKGQVAQYVTEVAAVQTPVKANPPPQISGIDHGQNHHDAKVFEAEGREIVTMEERVPEPITPMERKKFNAAALSREEATRRAKVLEDMYQEVKLNDSPKTTSSPVPDPTVLYDHKASPPRRIIISSSPYQQSPLLEPTPSFSSPHHQQPPSHTEPAIPTTTTTTTTTSSPPHLPETLATPNSQRPTSPSPPISESESESVPNSDRLSKSSKPKYLHISSLDGRIRHVDGVVEFKRMTVKEWRRERGRDRMLDPKKGKERRVLGI